MMQSVFNPQQYNPSPQYIYPNSFLTQSPTVFGSTNDIDQCENDLNEEAGSPPLKMRKLEEGTENRREVHNISEKKRRDKINEKIEELGHLITNSPLKSNKAAILGATVEHINYLNARHLELMERNRLLKIENHQLKQAHSKFVAPLLLANGANMSEEVNIGNNTGQNHQLSYHLQNQEQDTITQSNTQYTYYQGFPSYHYSHYQVSNYPVQASPIINNSSQIQTNYHYMEQKQFQEGENNTKHNIGQYSHPEIPTRGDHEERSELTSTHQFQ